MGFDQLFSWASRNKKIRNKALKAATKIGTQVFPTVKTVQAVHGIRKVGGIANNVNEVSNKLNDLIPKISKVTDQAEEFIPSMQVVGKSLCDRAKIFTYFNTIATVAGIGANIVLVYQGLQILQHIESRLKEISTSLAAQTALIAQREFPQYAYEMIQERLGNTIDDPDINHYFFLYHPDNDWYPNFYHLLKEKPFDPRFCGYTNQIDTIFSFMLATRRGIKEEESQAQKKGQPIRPVRIHLLIPAYQPILFAEALKIPEEIGDFVMEGRTNSNKEFVWLNLPQEQRHYVTDIGHWVPPTLEGWNWAMSKIGLVEAPPVLKEPRVLGTKQQSPEDYNNHKDGNNNGGDRADENDDVSNLEGEKLQDQSTPLHHRHQRHHRRRHRQDHSEGREGSRGRESTPSSSHREQRHGRRSRTKS